MEAFFLAATSGQRFCIFHSPQKGLPSRGGLVYVHPFAEEMNRSRRMAMLQARAFAEAGYAVLQIDLHGCGDSSGDFEDASWASWIEDVTAASDWLANRIEGKLWLWGLRSGCFLVTEVAKRAAQPPANLLLWQPVLSGRQHLNQFLRLKFAADLVHGTSGGEADRLADQLEAGQVVEVGGYRLSPMLAHGLQSATLEDPGAGSRVACLELSRGVAADVSPAMGAQLLRWEGAGCVVSGKSIQGPAFWQLIESEQCPGLIAASLAVVIEDEI